MDVLHHRYHLLEFDEALQDASRDHASTEVAHRAAGASTQQQSNLGKHQHCQAGSRNTTINHFEQRTKNDQNTGRVIVNIMATAFEPSFSASGNRQTMAPVGPSVADTLPSIDFGFDDLRDRMAKFTAKFDAFIEKGRKRVLEERNQFRMNVAELQGTAPLPIKTPKSQATN